MLSPQIVLLRFLDIGQFVMVNTMLMACVGLVGLIALKNRFQMNLTSFLMMFALFQFNGYIVARMGQGHSMWLGYFILPFFILFVRNISEGVGSPWKQSLFLSFSLLGIAMQGSLHMYVWCIMLLGLIAIFQKNTRKWIIISTLLSVGLTFWRLAPAALAFYNRTATFYSGYPSLLTFIEAFVGLQDSNHQTLPGFTGKVLGWWEYDYYLGVFGLLFVMVFAGYFYFRQQPRNPLMTPLAIMTALSFNCFYQIITMIPLPLANSERVSARFIVLVVSFFIVFACEEYSRMCRERAAGRNFKLFAGFAILQTAVELAAHSRLWSLQRLEKDLNLELIDFKIVQIDDSIYFSILGYSSLFSIVCFGVAIFCLTRYARVGFLRKLTEAKFDHQRSQIPKNLNSPSESMLKPALND